MRPACSSGPCGLGLLRSGIRTAGHKGPRYKDPSCVVVPPTPSPPGEGYHFIGCGPPENSYLSESRTLNPQKQHEIQLESHPRKG